jgi:hypothetical protein
MIVTKMMRRVLFLTSIWIAASSLTLFPQAQPPKPEAAPEEPRSVLAVPKDYRYNARGRRDPFVNPVPKPKTAAPVAPLTTRPPGLKGVLVNEAQITGVVTSKEPSMNVVIIAAPGAKAPYFARVGDELYDAVLKSIKMDTVTFAVTAPGVDPKAPREIVRKVRPKPGEDK